MSATGNELVKLSQLRGTINELRSAMQSTSLSDTNTTLIRTTGGSLAIKDGQELVKKVEGQSYVWNQLVQNGNFVNNSNWYFGGTLTISNNIATLSNRKSIYNALFQDVNIIPAHKYLIKADIKNSVANTNIKLRLDAYQIQVVEISTIADTEWHTYAGIGIAGTNLSAPHRIYVTDYNRSDFFETQVKNFSLYDLTAMGLGNITTVAQFKALFPNSYYEYNAGTLCSSNNEYKNIGRNLWDEEWEIGGINGTSGATESASDRIRSKNYIQVQANITYYAYIGHTMASNNFRVYYYDSNKNFISVGSWQYSATFTTPTLCSFIKFIETSKTIYNHDICINKSDASFNGTYEPYQSNLLSYNGTLEHKEWYLQLENLNWTYDSANSVWSASLPSNAKTQPYNNDFVPQAISEKYIAVSNALVYSTTNSFTISTIIRVNNGSSSTQPSGTLYYELATPTTETIVNATNVELKGVGTAKDTLYNESGLASWKNGLTEQVNKNGIVAIPYSVSEEFAVSINGQLGINAKINTAQTEALQELKDRMFFTDDSTKNPAQIYGGNWTQVGTQTIDTTTIYVWKKGV